MNADVVGNGAAFGQTAVQDGLDTAEMRIESTAIEEASQPAEDVDAIFERRERFKVRSRLIVSADFLRLPSAWRETQRLVPSTEARRQIAAIGECRAVVVEETIEQR